MLFISYGLYIQPVKRDFKSMDSPLIVSLAVQCYLSVSRYFSLEKPYRWYKMVMSAALRLNLMPDIATQKGTKAPYHGDVRYLKVQMGVSH